MKKSKMTKEKAQLSAQLNSWIIVILGLLFFYLAYQHGTMDSEGIMMILIGIVITALGIGRVMMMKKLLKEVEDVSDEEYQKIYRDMMDEDEK